MHIWQLEMQEQEGPKVGPGSWPILAHFAHPTSLCYIGKISEKNSEAPLDQILDCW